MRKKKVFISLGKELYGITKKAQPVASISSTRKKNVTLARNGASLNKGPDVLCWITKKDPKCQSLCSKCGKYICPKHCDIVCISCA